MEYLLLVTAHHPHHKQHHHKVHHKKKVHGKLLLWGSVVALLTLSTWYVASNFSVADNTMTKKNPTPQPTKKPSPVVVSVDEKKQIDQWIIQNNFNRYGDKKDTAYTGGTPLFNEMTGEYQNLYDYILSNYPDRPWKK